MDAEPSVFFQMRQWTPRRCGIQSLQLVLPAETAGFGEDGDPLPWRCIVNYYCETGENSILRQYYVICDNPSLHALVASLMIAECEMFADSISERGVMDV